VFILEIRNGEIMLGYLAAFIIGGIAGVLGMALFTSSSKTKIIRETQTIARRLDFLEREGESKRFKPVRDPRPQLHKLVN